MIISGSCLRTLFNAFAKDRVSLPISRCLIKLFLFSKIYSTGSSIVTILKASLWFISSIIAANVVLFPLPVGPVTSTNPFSYSIMFFNISGSFSSSKFCIFFVKILIENAGKLFSLYKFILYLLFFISSKDISISLFFSKISFCFSVNSSLIKFIKDSSETLPFSSSLISSPFTL